jgi:hypothetical protein
MVGDPGRVIEWPSFHLSRPAAWAKSAEGTTIVPVEKSGPEA